ncbi:MAG: hypothetical protein HGB12_17910, partial [Bacteroidetes bacterium]|nr:hypothetical protein [Bacteroidota bacterium]
EADKANKSYCYEIISYEEYKELQSRISTALDEALNKVREQQPNGSNAAHCTTEPIKANNSKGNKHRLKKLTGESKREEKKQTPITETETQQTLAITAELSQSNS